MQRRLQGFALVEVLITLTLGLLMIGAMAAFVVGQVTSQRRLLAQVRLAQDTRAAIDLVARELRRARHWEPAPDSAAPAVNPHTALWPDGDDTTATLGFSYTDHSDTAGVDAISATDRAGFRLDPRNPVLEMRLAGAATAPADADTWQPLTDPQSVRITQLRITPHVYRLSLLPWCARTACEAADPNCPPTQTLSVFDVELSAADPHDPAQIHTARTTVRVRNDAVAGACPS